MFHGTILNSSKLFVAVVVLIALYACQALAEAPWAMVGANSARTNQSSFPGPGEEMSLLWKAATPHDTDALFYAGVFATIAEDGTVFSIDNALFGYDADGHLLFERNLGPMFSYGTRAGMIDNDVVHAGLVNSLYTFSLNGNVLDQYTVPDSSEDYYFLTPALAPSGNIILPMRRNEDSIGFDGALSSVSADRGAEWTLDFGPLLYPPTVAEDGSVIVCTGDVNSMAWEMPTTLYCLRADGTLKWRNDDIALGLPMVDDVRGRVLVRSSLDHRQPSVLAFDLATGDFLWEYAPGGGYGYDEGINDGLGQPLALDATTGACYGFFDSCEDYHSQVILAIDADGHLAWYKGWADTDDVAFGLPSHPILDADGLVYVFYSRTELDQGVERGSFCCAEVFDPVGALLSQSEYPQAGSSDVSWALADPAIGPDNRIYMFAQDFDHPVTCSLYAFGPSETAPRQRPTILTAGYGLSDVTDQGGTLTISASVSHPLGASNISSVDVLINGQPTGFSLLPGVSRGEYSLSLNISAGMLNPGRFLLELVATDTEGNTSDVWPYFTVASAEPGQ